MGKYIVGLVRLGKMKSPETSTKWVDIGGPNYLNSDTSDYAVGRVVELEQAYKDNEGSYGVALFELRPQVTCVYNSSGNVVDTLWLKWARARASSFNFQTGPIGSDAVQKPATPAEAAKELRMVVRKLIAYDQPSPKASTGKPKHADLTSRFITFRNKIRDTSYLLTEELPKRRPGEAKKIVTELGQTIFSQTLLIGEMLEHIRQLEAANAAASPQNGTTKTLLQRASVLVQCLPTAEMPQGAAENTLRAIVAILRAHNYSVADVVVKDGALGDDSAVQAVVEELSASPHQDKVFQVGDRVIVNYNRAEREAAGFQDHITDAVIENQPGVIIANKGSSSELPFKVKLDYPTHAYSWWLPLESLQHEEVMVEEEVPEEEMAF